MIVTVIGDEPLAEASVVAAAIAARMEVEPNSLVLRRASVSSYLLVLLDLASVDLWLVSSSRSATPISSFCAKNGVV